MRRLFVVLALLLPTVVVHAQSSLLLQNLEVLDPTLTAAVTMSDASGDCQAPGIDVWQILPRSFTCYLKTNPNDQAVAADGTIIKWLSDEQSDPACITTPPTQRQAIRMFAVAPDKTTREVMRIDTARFSGCDAGYPTRISTAAANFAFDVTNGLLQVYVDRAVTDVLTGVNLAHDSGIVTVSGFPKLFDTLLSFTPGGAISVVTPAHPDGFRSADSIQVWAGDVRSLPDWSQAERLTCNATASPMPGQVVTVSDTLPDPPVGHGRYYLTASVNGATRRLGRQFVNGVFSARDPASLPACAP